MTQICVRCVLRRRVHAHRSWRRTSRTAWRSSSPAPSDRLREPRDPEAPRARPTARTTGAWCGRGQATSGSTSVLAGEACTCRERTSEHNTASAGHSAFYESFRAKRLSWCVRRSNVLRMYHMYLRSMYSARFFYTTRGIQIGCSLLYVHQHWCLF